VCLQLLPTRSGRPVWFLLIEDELGLLQCTMFESVYRKCGHVLHQTGAYLLEGSVEQDRRRGFSFIVDRIADLGEALATAQPSTPPFVQLGEQDSLSRPNGRRRTGPGCRSLGRVPGRRGLRLFGLAENFFERLRSLACQPRSTEVALHLALGLRPDHQESTSPPNS
jgi:hypothetical protein